jgi:hypothetical protein
MKAEGETSSYLNRKNTSRINKDNISDIAVIKERNEMLSFNPDGTAKIYVDENTAKNF